MDNDGSLTTGAQRLERVRERVGAANVRDFWKRLMDKAGSEYSVSYEAVRNYHSGREAPASYLVAVARAFGFNLMWLASGEGPATPGDAVVVQKPLGDAVWEAFVEGCRYRGHNKPTSDYTPPDSIRPLAFLLWQRRVRALMKDGGNEPGHFGQGHEVGMALFAPLLAFGTSPERFTETEIEEYCMAMASGIAFAADYYHEITPEEV